MRPNRHPDKNHEEILLEQEEEDNQGGRQVDDTMMENEPDESSSSSEDDEESGKRTTRIVQIKKQPQEPQQQQQRHERSKSLGANSDTAFFYSFRMPQDSSSKTFDNNGRNAHHHQARSSCLPSTRSTDANHNNSKKKKKNETDYKFVLDNYVEYQDQTKIPRLRGKDVDQIRAAIHSSHWAALCVAVIASCFLTHAISNQAPHLRADVSQALVIVLVLATFPEVAASAGAGAFAGMAGPTAIPTYAWLTLLSLVTSAVWLLFHRCQVLVGCGGRLGTCAFLSMNIAVALVAMPAGAVPWSLYGDRGQLWAERLEFLPSALAVVACTFISTVGGWVRLRSKIPLNPVQAPTTIALLCMLVLEPTDYKYVGDMDAGLAVGSFVAMASKQYLSTVGDFAAAGFVAGLWILFLEPFFLEFGGKKGFTAFCGFATYVVICKFVLGRSPGKEK